MDDSKAEGIANALIALASSDGKHAVAAAREIMDRLEGKVTMPVEAKIDYRDMTDEELEAEVERIVTDLGYVKRGKS